MTDTTTLDEPGTDEALPELGPPASAGEVMTSVSGALGGAVANASSSLVIGSGCP